MYTFGKTSTEHLATCNEKLQLLCEKALAKGVIDFAVIQGHRGEEEQNLYFNSGKSKAKFGESKHNTYPSKAVDVVPYPVDWNDTKRFCLLAGVILATAKELNINIRWGGDWNQDGKLKDNKFNDLPHFELM